ncbi:MAG TPA: guanylate kinase [Balneolales bacterium]|nr:guanylate kinase [Balneolales bacterium]
MSELGKGKIIILVAPSGSGKTTIAKRLLKDFENLTFSVSATTRSPREGEKNGKDYHFLSPESFQKNIDNRNFIEWEEFYNGKRYGSLRSEVEKQLNSGYYVLFDIEVKGALNIKKQFKDDCLTIFIKPPSLEVLKERLLKRNTETTRTLKERLERAKMELEQEKKFDAVVINDNLKKAYAKVKKIVESFMNKS